MILALVILYCVGIIAFAVSSGYYFNEWHGNMPETDKEFTYCMIFFCAFFWPLILFGLGVRFTFMRIIKIGEDLRGKK